MIVSGDKFQMGSQQILVEIGIKNTQMNTTDEYEKCSSKYMTLKVLVRHIELQKSE